jgi:hypothetical protein
LCPLLLRLQRNELALLVAKSVRQHRLFADLVEEMFVAKEALALVVAVAFFVAEDNLFCSPREIKC